MVIMFWNTILNAIPVLYESSIISLLFSLGFQFLIVSIYSFYKYKTIRKNFWTQIFAISLNLPWSHVRSNKKLGWIGLVVLTFIGYKRKNKTQTNKPGIYIYIYICSKCHTQINPFRHVSIQIKLNPSRTVYKA